MWDQRYGEAGFAYGTEPNAFLAEQAPKHFGPGDKILSLAEGEGRNAVYLAGLGADVTGVDGSAVGLAKAEALAAERGLRIRTVHSDLGDFDLGGSAWDGIISIWAHVPLELRRRLHRGVVKALKPGGVFLLEMYHPDQVALGTGGLRTGLSWRTWPSWSRSWRAWNSWSAVSSGVRSRKGSTIRAPARWSNCSAASRSWRRLELDCHHEQGALLQRGAPRGRKMVVMQG